MNHSMPGLPVCHQFLESTQTHAHRVGDAIQPSHLLYIYTYVYRYMYTYIHIHRTVFGYALGPASGII